MSEASDATNLCFHFNQRCKVEKVKDMHAKIKYITHPGLGLIPGPLDSESNTLPIKLLTAIDKCR